MDRKAYTSTSMARDQGSDHSPALGTAEAYQILESCITCMYCMGAQQGASHKKRLSRKDEAPFKHTTTNQNYHLQRQAQGHKMNFVPRTPSKMKYYSVLHLWILLHSPLEWQQQSPLSAHPHTETRPASPLLWFGVYLHIFIILCMFAQFISLKWENTLQKQKC